MPHPLHTGRRAGRPVHRSRPGEGRRRRRLRALGIMAATLGTAALPSLGAVPPAAVSSLAVSPAAAGGSMLEVAAAENFWGSIAAQIGGVHVHVTSIITNPNTDPHAYEPTPADARTLAASRVVIENGIGYDPWVAHLLAADDSTATVLDVGQLLSVPVGGNPHRWYDPVDVQAVVDRLVADFQRADPADRRYFDQRRTLFDTVALRPYHALAAAIRAGYAATPVGASESIVSMLAPSLGLDVITPPSFLRAVSEGSEVSAADEETIDTQIARHQIRIYLYNRQNVPPDVAAQVRAARAAHIPTVTITETLSPPGVPYQVWQTRELRSIEAALATATGRPAPAAAGAP